MKPLIAILLLSVSAPAQVSIDLVQVVRAIKARHDKVPAVVKWRRITAGLAAAASVGDMVTTYDALERGRCEVNPILVGPDGCSINKRRFTALKVGLFTWLAVGEEVAHRLPHGHIWDRENIILNSGMAAAFTGISIRNATR